MLNFREEFNEIRAEKLYGNESIRHQAEFILKNILGYFRVKPKEEFEPRKMKLKFEIDNDKLSVKEYCKKKEKEIYNFVFLNSETAKEVLCYLESELIEEGCEKTSLLPAKDYNCFVVEI